MGQYRCLNCGSYTSDTETKAEVCGKRGCGFKVGRYEYDAEYYIPSYSSGPKWWPPLTPLQKLGVGLFALAMIPVGFVVLAFSMTSILYWLHGMPNPWFH